MKKEDKKNDNKKIPLLKIEPELKKYFAFLLGSLSFLTLIWTAGAFFNGVTNNTKKNTESIIELRNEIKNNNNNIQNYIIELHELNNNTWKKKFDLYIKYGNNKELILNLLESEDYVYDYNLRKISIKDSTIVH